MLTNNEIKIYRSLQKKKYREQYELYLVEGEKLISDALKSGYLPEKLIVSKDVVERHPGWRDYSFTITADNNTISRISSLKKPQGLIAVYSRYISKHIELLNNLNFALDCIQDPGNLGTVIRIADWFGIKNIICSTDTADFTNPKVIQAAMGAHFRVNIIYTNLAAYLLEARKSDPEIKIYGSFMDGESIYKTYKADKSIIVLGNEGQGISQETEKVCTDKISIPSFQVNSDKMESLNISVAAGILCSEFRRENI